MRENPYRLAFDVWGIGFLSADKLAAALGIGKETDVRIEAGVRHVLDEAGGQGHVYVAARAARRRTPACASEVDRGAGRAGHRPARAGGARSPSSALEDRRGGVRDRPVARRARRRRGPAPHAARAVRLLAVDPDRAIACYEKQADIALAPRQAEAVRRALGEPVLVITGGPGVGKTTIVRGIVSTSCAGKLRVALAAPTGRAAKRLPEATGQPAATLHRLLEWRPGRGHVRPQRRRDRSRPTC